MAKRTKVVLTDVVDGAVSWPSAQKQMSKAEWAAFNIWISGQTVPMREGETWLWAHDVERFLEMKRNKKPTYWD